MPYNRAFPLVQPIECVTDRLKEIFNSEEKMVEVYLCDEYFLNEYYLQLTRKVGSV
jgi:hypothetical protein